MSATPVELVTARSSRASRPRGLPASCGTGAPVTLMKAVVPAPFSDIVALPPRVSVPTEPSASRKVKDALLPRVTSPRKLTALVTIVDRAVAVVIAGHDVAHGRSGRVSSGRNRWPAPLFDTGAGAVGVLGGPVRVGSRSRGRVSELGARDVEPRVDRVVADRAIGAPERAAAGSPRRRGSSAVKETVTLPEVAVEGADTPVGAFGTSVFSVQAVFPGLYAVTSAGRPCSSSSRTGHRRSSPSSSRSRR